MQPGSLFVRTWFPSTKTPLFYPDTLTIYDAGDKQGFLIQEHTGNTKWLVFHIDSRWNAEEDVKESGILLPESEAPFQYASIETYPLQQERLGTFQFLFSLPAIRILVTTSPPGKQPLPLPSLLQSPTPVGLDSHGPPRSSSKRRVDEQRLSQNKNKPLPKKKALPSSNPNAHGQPESPTPRRQAPHPIQPLPVNHTEHESSESAPWLSLAQQSLYSRPPPEVEGELSGQVLTSQNPKDSQRH